MNTDFKNVLENYKKIRDNYINHFKNIDYDKYPESWWFNVIKNDKRYLTNLINEKIKELNWKLLKTQYKDLIEIPYKQLFVFDYHDTFEIETINIPPDHQKLFMSVKNQCFLILNLDNYKIHEDYSFENVSTSLEEIRKFAIKYCKRFIKEWQDSIEKFEKYSIENLPKEHWTKNI